MEREPLSKCRYYNVQCTYFFTFGFKDKTCMSKAAVKCFVDVDFMLTQFKTEKLIKKCFYTATGIMEQNNNVTEPCVYLNLFCACVYNCCTISHIRGQKLLDKRI